MHQSAFADVRLTALTRDNVRLAVHRVFPKGNVRGAVVLMHGLGCNRYAFHFPGRSLAHYLAEAGWDCFVPELRGCGESDSPRGPTRLDDLLTYDVPAILETVKKASPGRPIHWVGHSLGGILLLAHLIHTEDTSIRSGVTLASALDYTQGPSSYSALAFGLPLVRPVPFVPWGLVTHVFSPVLGRVPNPLERFNFAKGATEPAIVRALHANGFGRIPMSLFESLATAFETNGFRTQDGFRFLEQAHRLKTPLLLVSGDEDKQINSAAVAHTAKALGQHAVYLPFGRAHGNAHAYGHFDLVLGRHAPDEVWPRIANWLSHPGRLKTQAS